MFARELPYHCLCLVGTSIEISNMGNIDTGSRNPSFPLLLCEYAFVWIIGEIRDMLINTLEKCSIHSIAIPSAVFKNSVVSWCASFGSQQASTVTHHYAASFRVPVAPCWLQLVPHDSKTDGLVLSWLQY